MRVAMVGAGGLGGLSGGLLARSGLDVTFIARGRNLEALREGGLSVKLWSGEEFHVPVRATDDPREVGPVDLLWFCVKTYDLPAAARLAVPLVGPATMVLSIQNGVEAPEQLAAVLGRAHVLASVARMGATLVAPGRVEQKHARQVMVFGELDGGSSARSEALSQLLMQAGFEPSVSLDIRLELWDKCMQACGVFALDALLRLPDLGYLRQPPTVELFRGLLREVYDVGRARGVDLPADTVERVFTTNLRLLERYPQIHSSMYYDVLAGRPLELEATNGSVVRLGHEHGVLTPLNFALYAALKPFAAGKLGATVPALPQ